MIELLIFFFSVPKLPLVVVFVFFADTFERFYLFPKCSKRSLCFYKWMKGFNSGDVNKVLIVSESSRIRKKWIQTGKTLGSTKT